MFKPMKASHIETPGLLKFPLLVSPKLDGIRCMVQEGIAVSRNLTAIRNMYTKKVLSNPILNNLDGELIMGDPYGEGVFQRTSSAVMSFQGEPELTYYVFDKYGDFSFENRLEMARITVDEYMSRPIVVKFDVRILNHIRVDCMEELDNLETAFVDEGYEGAMVRSLTGKYKEGRSTEREGWLLKLKRFRDSEARILGMEEEMHNSNEAARQVTGKLKRSKTKDGLIGKGRLGSLFCEDMHTGVQFNMSGFNDEMKAKMWANKAKYLDRIVKYKYFPVGVKDRPRHPNFVGFRDLSDMD